MRFNADSVVLFSVNIQNYAIYDKVVSLVTLQLRFYVCHYNNVAKC